jgi:hypothetical protein
MVWTVYHLSDSLTAELKSASITVPTPQTDMSALSGQPQIATKLARPLLMSISNVDQLATVTKEVANP